MAACWARGTLLGLGLLLCGCGGSSTARGTPGGGASSNSPPDGVSSHGGTSSNGAGGRAGAVSAGSGGTDGEIPSNGGDATAAGGDATSGAGGACAGEACGLAVDPTPLWVTRLSGYGRGPAWVRFSKLDELVYIGEGQTQVYFTSALDRTTGQVVGVPLEDRTLIAADESGRWLIRQVGQDCIVFDDETEAFRFQCFVDKKLQFSPDGSALAHYACLSEKDELVQLDIYGTKTGERIATTQANLPCLYGADDWNALIDSKHRRSLFAHPERDDLYVFDWDSQSLTTRSVHQSFPRSLDPLNREGTILNLSMSHDGQTLVSVGAADGLAWHDRESLNVEFRVPEVPFFNLYDKCYCTYLAESPVAWSPADEIYATAHPSGGIELRSAATQGSLAVLEPPSDPEVIKQATSSGYGPALIQFAPDLRHLVALYPRYAVGYSLSH
jgi:hypothetical protein